MATDIGTDIVERLRDFAANAELWGDHGADLGLDAADEIEQMRIDTVPRSWDGLMQILDAVYPADIFTGVSGGPGPRIVVLLRQINEIRRAVA